MTAAKHTPGPWLIDDFDKAFVYTLGPGGTNKFWAPIQASGPEKISRNEAEANARLIAAAPDLLSALMALADDITERFDMSSPSTNPGMKNAVKDALAAIAKATEVAP